KDNGVGTAIASINVTSVAPIPGAITGPIAGVRGQPRTYTFTATDSSAADQAAGFTFTIAWGDGTTDTVTGPSGTTATHIYQATGVTTIAVTARDKDNGVDAGLSRQLSVSTLSILLQSGVLLVGGTTGVDVITLTPLAPGSTVIQYVNNGSVPA